MTRLRWAIGVLLAAALSLALLLVSRVPGQQILQYGFEARDPVWAPGGADAAFKEVVHRLTDETAHGGQRCEHIRIQAEKGTYIHYTYDIGRAPITEELNLSLWLKSNRPNVGLLCRVVLPRERDPANPAQPMTLLLRCEPYGSTRWKLVTLRQPIKRLQEQQQLLRHQLGRDVIIADAYIDRLVLNVYDGPGLTDVWIDDLEVGPVFDLRPPGSSVPAGRTTAQPASRRAGEVVLRGDQLYVSGQRFFIRGIRHTGTPLKTLRDAGFNTVWIDESTPAAVVEDAVNLGFWLVPSLRLPQESPDGRTYVDAQLTSNQEFGRKVARFLDQDAVLCWDLGSNLGAERFSQVARVARAFRTADPMRPLSADVWDGFKSYSLRIDPLMLGVHRWPLLTGMEVVGYRDWLTQRRRLAAPGTFCWTWIQTHLPDWFLPLATEGQAPGSPLGPQPEQIRLLAYTALGCGYRGLGFWSDRFLADSHTGRDRLLALALLNQELQMLEPILVKATKEPTWIPTSRSEVLAAVIRIPGAVLVLPVWMGVGSQYVPGQGATHELTLVVPQVPATAQAWEVSPGGVRAYRTERVLGGTKVTLRNFSLTGALLFTSDLSPTGVVVRLQDQQRHMGRLAAQWIADQAREELRKVEQVQSALEAQGHTVPDAAPLLKRAQDSLARCAVHRRNGDHASAYDEAQIALRALRVLMRADWERAVRDLDSPVASPYAVSFFTLPQHWRFLDEIQRMRAAANVLPDGDFETPPERVPAGWMVQEVPSLDEIVPLARRVDKVPNSRVHAGKQCLVLSISPKPKVLLPPQVLERTFLAIHSPAVHLPPGTLVRITAWVNIPSGIGASTDGALIYDSAGGEPLALRLNATKGWKRFYLFRRVPASGKIHVTLAVTGIGGAYFDDVRIEPLVPLGGAGTVAAAPAPAGRQRPLPAGPQQAPRR
jgi:hypothetical protein